MPTPDFDFDFLVIGGGSGGVRAARRAAEHGARTALVEQRHLGGTCVNVGCVPKKLMVYAAEIHEALRLAPGYGWSAQATFSWSELVAHRDREIGRLRGIYRGLLADSGVTLLEGTAVLDSPCRVRVDGRAYGTRRILIATGSTPVRPELPGAESAIVSDQAFHLPELPRRICIVGGGYIGVEFACIFAGLGAQVTLLHRGGRILRGFDQEAAEFLAGALRRQPSFTLRLHTRITRIRTAGNALAAETDQGEELQADTLLYAVGRQPATAGLGLEQAGVKTGPRGEILIDRRYRSSVPSIHAIGDVTSRIMLTPTAIAEAEILTRGLFRDDWRELDYGLIPSAVFSHPCLAMAGLTEEQARHKHGPVQVLRTRTNPLKYALAEYASPGFLKLVVRRSDGRLLGAHLVGPEAAEMVQGFTLALRAGATLAMLHDTIGIHPTLAEEFFSLY